MTKTPDQSILEGLADLIADDIVAASEEEDMAELRTVYADPDLAVENLRASVMAQLAAGAPVAAAKPQASRLAAVTDFVESIIEGLAEAAGLRNQRLVVRADSGTMPAAEVKGPPRPNVVETLAVAQGDVCLLDDGETRFAWFGGNDAPTSLLIDGRRFELRPSTVLTGFFEIVGLSQHELQAFLERVGGSAHPAEVPLSWSR